jgi:hypothetical protein
MSDKISQNRSTVTFGYRNYKGEFAVRTAEPMRLVYGLSQHHTGYQWFMEAVAVDREGEVRMFALNDVTGPITSTKAGDDGQLVSVIKSTVDMLHGPR